MAASLQDIPVFVLEHKWSSDVDLNDKSNFQNEINNSNLLNYSKKKYFMC